MNKITYDNSFKLALLVLPVFYLLFPNNNQTIDAWEYAQNVKYGIELFKPHHLLYNWLLYNLKLFPLFKTVDTMRFMQSANGFFTIFSLYFLYRILLALYNDKRKSLVWTLFVGCAFATLRYATENETYIIPILFSIIASYFFLLFIQQRETGNREYLLFLSGLFASISCLFHQIHFFWWLALLVGVFLLPKPKPVKEFLVFVLPAFIVPIVYVLVMWFYTKTELSLHNYLSFVFEYYYSENSDVSVSGLNFILSPISLFRSFLQVHGNIINFFLARPIISSLSIVFFIFCIYRFIFPLKFKLSFNNKNTFVNIHFIAFILQFAFAFYSKGNAEFMVMLPFLFSICFSYWLTINEKKLFFLSVAMLTWNITFAILPNHYYNFQNNEKLIEIIKSYPEKNFILKERNKIVAQYKYFYDDDISDRAFYVEEIINDNEEGIFLTDIISKQQPYSRATIVSEKFGLDYTFMRKISEIHAFYGNYSVEEILVKNSTDGTTELTPPSPPGRDSGN